MDQNCRLLLTVITVIASELCGTVTFVRMIWKIFTTFPSILTIVVIVTHQLYNTVRA